MDKLYPIVRRVRRPLLPPDELISREGTGVRATALHAEDELVKPAEEVSGGTPDTTRGTRVLPNDE